MGISTTDYSNYKGYVEALVHHPLFPEKEAMVARVREELLHAMSVGDISLREYDELCGRLRHALPPLDPPASANPPPPYTEPSSTESPP